MTFRFGKLFSNELGLVWRYANGLLAIFAAVACFVGGVFSQQNSRRFIVASYVVCIAGGYSAGLLAARAERAQRHNRQVRNVELTHPATLHPGESISFSLGQVALYEIGPNSEWIRCRVCGMTSYSRQDVESRYCGNCNTFFPERSN